MTRLRVVLAASVLLNLFLAGALAGGALLVRSRSPVIAAGSLRIAGAELPREARRARQDAAALLRRPVVDLNALKAALARARAADAIVRAGVDASAVRFAATLPPADRARIADAMRRRAENTGR